MKRKTFDIGLIMGKTCWNDWRFWNKSVRKTPHRTKNTAYIPNKTSIEEKNSPVFILQIDIYASRIEWFSVFYEKNPMREVKSDISFTSHNVTYVKWYVHFYRDILRTLFFDFSREKIFIRNIQKIQFWNDFFAKKSHAKESSFVRNTKFYIIRR